ncbi:MAG TPA: PLP-dependent transferase [Candidatus Faecousia intestinigallinarum]|nr:PLP-dependent transferase [Candidatus Faecousia intestinigallinarum]
MTTPIWDFVRSYAASGTARLHMPGHKGRSFLGCEAWDITEIRGADSLYEADGIIAESQANAAGLFGSGGTFYAAGGSSQCIGAMLYLALTCRPAGAAAMVLAARNVHKAFIHAAALLDIAVTWIWPEESAPLCSCPISPAALEAALAGLPQPPAAVYITSPDYLGGVADIARLAEVCHQHGTILAVDNAHGAYLHFLEHPCHPLDLGADICCDSAHKTLPVLTGGAYLHIGKNAPAGCCSAAKEALALFGSTSPSYLTLSSLDLCNQYLSGDYRARLGDFCRRLDALRAQLRQQGWRVLNSDPLRLTVQAAGQGGELAAALEKAGGAYEYADPDHLVLMLTPENTLEELALIGEALEGLTPRNAPLPKLSPARGRQICTIRQAMFQSHRLVPVEEALGRVCGAPAVSCPPAVPIAVSGEEITREAAALFRYYHIPLVEIAE